MSEKTTSAEEPEATQETEPEKKTIAAARTTKTRKSSARKATKRKTAKRKAPKKKAAKRKVPEKTAAKRKAAKRKAPEKTAAKRKAPKKKAAKRKAAKRKAPKKKAAKRKAPKKKAAPASAVATIDDLAESPGASGPKSAGLRGMAATASAARVKGLDLGTSRIVLAKPHGENMNFEVQLNAFVTLPLSNMTKSMFERAGILHFVEDYQIIAYGNRVDDFANMLSGDTQRPMQNGLLNAAEPKSLQIVELAIENICGPARKGEKITFSVPSTTPENESDLIYHQQAITQLLENLGYKVQSVNEGLAVVYSELMESDFTGFGISFGAGLCNVCFAYLGLPVLNFCMTRAGDYIDRCAASVTGETLTNLRLYKERDFSLTGFHSVKVDQALSVYYDDVIQGVVRGIEQQLAESNKIPNLNHPVPVAFAGGTARVGGFQAALQEALESADLPIEISVVRLSKDPLNTTAKGTFVAAATNM